MILSQQKAYKILIVDDVPHNIQVLANILKEAGYQLGFAKDGKAALAHIESTNYDLILLDIMMPGIDGIKVLESIREHSKVPVIMLTARSETFMICDVLDMGADDYVVKPFGMKELRARIKAKLRRNNFKDQ